jgi:predicted SAM-dependent methyltransferase
MLFGLKSLMAEIAERRLDEGEVYRREKAYQRARGPQPAAGFLHCPICGTTASRFLPFGLANRRNAQCPTCGSIERHRLVWLYLNEHSDFFHRRHRVLHTAPEPCLEPRLRGHHGRRYISVDAFNPAADVQADLTDLPFPDAHFDVILSSHVLEHIQDDLAAMAELARVLKPGGWALILVPYDPTAPTREDRTLSTPAQRMAAYGHPYHYRIYGTDLTDRLKGAGLSTRILSTNSLLSGHRKRRYRINRNYLMLCRKI